MKHAVAVCAALSIVSIVSSCAGDKKNNTAGQAAPLGVAWTAKLDADCGASVAREQCVGGYGFSVLANGTYKVGPASDQGRALTGTLSQEEFASFERLVNTALSESAPQANSADSACITQPQADSKDTVSLEHQGASTIIATVDGTQLCHPGAKGKTAEALHNAIRTLAEKYYSLPYPDACVYAADDLEATYDSARTCSSDEDCRYFTQVNDDAVEPGTVQKIVTETCSFAKPLTVANPALVKAKADELKVRRQALADACGARKKSQGCTEADWTGFQNEKANPQCVNNKCQVNPQSLRQF